MKTLRRGEELAPEKDCTEVLLPYRIKNGQLIVDGKTINEEFRRWYEPLVESR